MYDLKKKKKATYKIRHTALLGWLFVYKSIKLRNADVTKSLSHLKKKKKKKSFFFLS